MSMLRTVIATAATLCLTGAPASASISVTDGLGREVSIAEPAERVVVVAPFAVDVLLELGVTPVLRPTLQGEAPASWDGIGVLPVAHSTGPSLERVVAAEPDLVILDQTFSRFASTIEQTIGCAVLVCDTRSLDDIRSNCHAIGVLVGRADRAESMVAQLDQDLAEIAAKAGERSGEKISVFAMFGTPASFFAFQPDSYLGSLCGLMGVELVTGGGKAAKLFQGFTPFSLERVIAADPDVMLIVRHGEDLEGERRMREHPAWGSISAVREGRLHVLDEKLFVMYPGMDVRRAATVLERVLYAGAPDGAPVQAAAD